MRTWTEVLMSGRSDAGCRASEISSPASRTTRFGRDGRHAAMIDRAFPEKARAALDVFTDHARQASRRAGPDVIRGAEYCHRGHVQSRSNVHASRSRLSDIPRTPLPVR